MLKSKLTATIIVLFSVLFSTQALALTQEIKVNLDLNKFPLVTVIMSSDREPLWSAALIQGGNSVVVLNLDLNDAKAMLKIADKADNSYDEMKAMGRCPTSTVRSGTLGRLEGWGGSLWFEVVCEKNNILVHVTMLDEYAINQTLNKLEGYQLRILAKNIIRELER